jgi:hypothetical protein
MAIIEIIVAARGDTRGIYLDPDVDYTALTGDFDYNNDDGGDSYGVNLFNWPDGLQRFSIAAGAVRTFGAVAAYTTTGFVEYSVHAREHTAIMRPRATTIYEIAVHAVERISRSKATNIAAAPVYTANNWNQDYVTALTNAAKVDPALAAMLKDTNLTVNELIAQIQKLQSSST